MKPALPILLFALSLSSFSLADETNDSSSLFGITITNQVSAAEKQFNLGSAYFSGDGVEQDLPKAIEYFRKAAELGHGHAQFNLGLCYMNGSGVEQSDQEAALWLKKAADQGIKEAIYPLGVCCYNLEQYTEAYAWSLAAEANGDSRLKEMLTPMYSEEEIAAGKARFEELKTAQKKPETDDSKPTTGN